MLAQVDPKLNKSLFERLLEQCARRALQGSKWHMGILLDYGLGKPKQSVGVEGGSLETLVKVIHIGAKESGPVSNS